MPREVRVLPHRTAAPESVEWGPLWLTINGVRDAVKGLVDDWDYASRVTVDFDVRLDSEGIMASTGLDESAGLAVVGMVDCPATFDRVTSVVPFRWDRDESVHVEVPLPAGSTAEALNVTRHLVLAQPASGQDDAVAALPGARLYESKKVRVQLEGFGGRFPTEPVAFSGLGLEAAAWRLDLTYQDLDDSFMRSVRLIVNTEHATAVALDSNHPSHEVVMSVMRFDVIRQMLFQLAADETVILEGGENFEEGSLGAVLEYICDFFLRRDLRSVLELLRNDPPEFEMLAQARLGLLTKVPQ